MEVICFNLIIAVQISSISSFVWIWTNFWIDSRYISWGSYYRWYKIHCCVTEKIVPFMQFCMLELAINNNFNEYQSNWRCIFFNFQRGCCSYWSWRYSWSLNSRFRRKQLFQMKQVLDLSFTLAILAKPMNQFLREL